MCARGWVHSYTSLCVCVCMCVSPSLLFHSPTADLFSADTHTKTKNTSRRIHSPFHFLRTHTNGEVYARSYTQVLNYVKWLFANAQYGVYYSLESSLLKGKAPEERRGPCLRLHSIEDQFYSLSKGSTGPHLRLQTSHPGGEWDLRGRVEVLGPHV